MAAVTTAAARPTTGEVAELLRDYAAMTAAAGGRTTRIPAGDLAAWEARKDALLERIAEATGRRPWWAAQGGE